jgi:hypothetical protein
MNDIFIQVHAKFDSNVHSKILAYLMRDADMREIRVIRGRPKDGHTNYLLRVRSVRAYWASNATGIAVVLAKNSYIATGTGKHGWDDYILLRGIDGSTEATPRKRPRT